MTHNDIYSELQRRGVAACLITRLRTKIMPQFGNLDDFAKATDSDITKAYADQLREDWVKAGSKGSLAKPFMGAKLKEVVSAAQTFIVDSRLTKAKQLDDAEKARQQAIEDETRRNPVFTIGALRSVIALCELAGVDRVNLMQIFQHCDAFGISLDEQQTKILQKDGTVTSV